MFDFQNDHSRMIVGVNSGKCFESNISEVEYWQCLDGVLGAARGKYNLAKLELLTKRNGCAWGPINIKHPKINPWAWNEDRLDRLGECGVSNLVRARISSDSKKLGATWLALMISSSYFFLIRSFVHSLTRIVRLLFTLFFSHFVHSYNRKQKAHTLSCTIFCHLQ